MQEQDERVTQFAKRIVAGMRTQETPTAETECPSVPAASVDSDGAAKPLLSVANDIIDRIELAQLLRVDPRTVSRMVARGELPEPCISRGGRPRWLRHFVMEFLEKRHRKQSELNRRKESKIQ